MSQEKVSVEELFAKLAEEKKTGELSVLPEDFYLKASGGTEDSHENATIHDENRRKLIGALKARRQQKMLTYLAYGKNLPHPIPKEEERLYILIKKILDEENKSTRSTKIKIISDAPELVTTEGRKIGPFEKNTIIDVENQEDLEFMLKNKIAETINQ